MMPWVLLRSLSVLFQCFIAWFRFSFRDRLLSQLSFTRFSSRSLFRTFSGVIPSERQGWKALMEMGTVVTLYVISFSSHIQCCNLQNTFRIQIVSTAKSKSSSFGYSILFKCPIGFCCFLLSSFFPRTWICRIFWLSIYTQNKLFT